MQAWEKLLKEQECLLGRETAQKWLKTLKVLHFDACNLYLEAKDSFQALWFEEHIRPHIKKSFRNNNHKLIKVHLSISEPPKPLNASPSPKKSPADTTLQFDELNPEYTYDTFIPSQANTLSYRLLCELGGYDPTESQKQSNKLGLFNPVFLHGPSGCGKTHLAIACAHQLRSMGKKVVYARAETFTAHVVRAIRLGLMKAFRQAYRQADVLILDNIQVLARKNATQEELFHTFNTLHNQGKQIILLADCSPMELQSVEPRLVSRFEWGLATSLKMLGAKEHKTLLQARAKTYNFLLSSEVEDFLIDSFGLTTKSLVKALEALYIRLFLNKKASQSPMKITLDLVKKILKDLLDQEKQTLLTPEKIIQTVADFYGIKSEDILGKSQSRETVAPRQVAMHLCRLKLKLPFMKIGSIFSRDHSTVMTSVKNIQKALDKEKHSELSQNLLLIQKRLFKRDLQLQSLS